MLQQTQNPTARILVVDDVEVNVDLACRALRLAGYQEVKSATNPAEVPELFSEFQPEIMLLDLHMPGMDGIELFTALKPLCSTTVKTLFLTADSSPEQRQRAMEQGAIDVLYKPWDLVGLITRIEQLHSLSSKAVSTN